MKNNFAKLIDLKSIITILLVVTLVVLVVGNLPINDEAIKTLFTSVTTGKNPSDTSKSPSQHDQ